MKIILINSEENNVTDDEKLQLLEEEQLESFKQIMQHIRKSTSPENGAFEFARISRQLMASRKGDYSKKEMKEKLKTMTKNMSGNRNSMGFDRKSKININI